MSVNMEARIEEFRKFVKLHLTQTDANYNKNPDKYMEEVLIPYNMQMIELVTGTECVKKGDTIGFKHMYDVPSSKEFSEIMMLAQKWGLGNKFYAQALRAIEQIDVKGNMPVFTMPEDGKAYSHDDFEKELRGSLKRIIKPEEFLTLMLIATIQKEALRMRKMIYCGIGAAALVGMGLIGFYSWKKKSGEVDSEFEYGAGIDQLEDAPVIVPANDEIPEE